ncbi:MAG: hypothetical protein LBV71_04290 [Prevotella sp.]|jgi:hypothetical protein|nr:hypothetical protein [Prevotella sp.]
MKNRCFLLFFILPVLILAQTQGDFEKRYIYDQFTSGRVVYKDGGGSNGLFNYDTVLERLLFVSEDKILEISNPSDVAFVKIDDRTFEHIKGGIFYEKILVNNDNAFYIQWKSKLKSKGKKEGYGMTSNTSAVTSWEDVYTGHSPVVKLNVNEDLFVDSNNSYYLKIKNSYKKFYSLDSLAKLFKGREEEIKGYLKDQNLNFKKLNDIKKAIEYCSQYME